MAEQAGGKQFSAASLYVGDLDASVTEDEIYSLFCAVGNVTTLRLCRDVVTRRSLGYAYVNFSTAEEATVALEALNLTQVKGKPIRVMVSSRDPSVRKSGTGNLYVKNLDKSIDSKALLDMFAPFGKIASCKLPLDDENVPKGFGFVQFMSEDAAQKAVEALNGTKVRDKILYVGPFVRRQERDTGSGTSKFQNVFVKNLPESTTDEELAELFGTYGSISSAVIMKDDDGKSKCFGFVNFEKPEAAAAAVEGLNGKAFQSKELYVGRAQKKTEREAELKAKFTKDHKDEANLYVKNLDDSIDDDNLRSYFESFGDITSCKVMKDQQGHSKGCGFVSFASPDAAKHAILAMNGRIIGKKPLYVAEAQKKEERSRLLQAQYAGNNVRMLAPGQQFGFVPPQPLLQPQMQPMTCFAVNAQPMTAQPVPRFHNLSRVHQQRQLRNENVNQYQHLVMALAGASQEQQRQILGERLYPLVAAHSHDNASKLTGMLLDLPQQELLHLLQSPLDLRHKITEAKAALDDARRAMLTAEGFASLSLAA